MSSSVLPRLACAAALATVFSVSHAAPAGWFDWPVVEPANGSALDTSALNATPLDTAGRISTKDSAYVTADGRPIRFFGVNITSDDAFPTEADAELLARRLAKAGVNIARLHHLDNPWGVGTGGSIWPKNGRHRELDAAQLDRLHRLVAILAKHGIYSNLNLKVSKTLAAADGFPESVAQLPDFNKRVDFFDRRMIELQKDYARRLLTTKNPYTGFAPVDDPAVAIIEINNENSVLGYFTRDIGQGLDRLPEPFRSDLTARWNDWLARRYTDTAALAAAWSGDATNASVAIFDPATARWLPKIQTGSAATIEPGADGSSFAVQVSKTGGADWHVQVSTYGLRIEDNTVYTVACEVRAAAPAKLGVGLSNDDHARPGEPWRSLGLLRSVDVGTEWTPVRLAFPAHSVAGNPAVLSFNVAAQTGRFEFRHIRLVTGAAEGGLRPGQSLEASNVPLPGEPTTRQWGDWIAFLASIDRTFAEEMRTFLRDELRVQAPLAGSQINFTGIPALDREQSMEFADTHMYWEHPIFPGSGWDRANWTIANSPQLATFGPRYFGELGALAYFRVAGKPFAVSEYDHAAPSEYVCEMYPEFAILGCRQNWDALYAFDLGTYGSRNPDGRITGYFDQINHPAKWSLAPFATRVFRAGLITPATAVAELRPGNPVWAEAMHFDMLWAKLNPDRPFDFLDCRLQVNDRPTIGAATLVRSGSPDTPPARVIKAPQGQVLVAAADRAAVATGFLGGADIAAGPLHITCPRFGRDFATAAAVALDEKPLTASARVLVTIVARAENTGMKWNTAHNSVGTGWGHGPTITERVPATISLAVAGPRTVYTLRPDGTRARKVKTAYKDGVLSFTVSPKDNTLHYEIVAK
ncbi:MAG: hypothetical protein QM691_14595 [Opitutaceae bacterium]